MNPTHGNLGLALCLCAHLLVAGCDRSHTAPPAADTPDARRAAAERYMARVPLTDTLAGAIEQLLIQREPARRDELRHLLRAELRPAVIQEATVQALAKHFTVAEINALTEFSARPEARTIQQKMPAYTVEVLPALRNEIQRVLSMTNAALAALQWTTRLRSFTATAADEQWTTDFPFVNQSERTVRILAVTSTCACVSGVTDSKNYLPRQGGYVRVNFDFGPRGGQQSKYVVVQTDDPCEPQTRLQVDVQIPEVLRIEPPFSAWLVGAAPCTKTNRVSVLYPDVHIEGITTTNTAFRAAWHSGPPCAGEIYVTPVALTARTAGFLEVLVRVPPGVVRRFPLYLVIGSEKPPGR